MNPDHNESKEMDLIKKEKQDIAMSRAVSKSKMKHDRKLINHAMGLARKLHKLREHNHYSDRVRMTFTDLRK